LFNIKKFLLFDLTENLYLEFTKLNAFTFIFNMLEKNDYGAEMNGDNTIYARKRFHCAFFELWLKRRRG